MMVHKRHFVYVVFLLFIGGTLSTPLIQACEESENSDEKEDTKNESFNSLTFFDKLIERYPLLDQIIQMLLDLLFNWLTSFTAADPL